MSQNKELESLIHEYTSMGFHPQDIIMAWFKTNQKPSLMLDNLLIMLKEKEKNSGPQKNNDELDRSQKQIEKAIKLSLEEREKYYKPDQLLRNNGKPVGLKNVGNTCYFNSLIQTIFQVPDFLLSILTFRAPSDVDKAVTALKISDSTILNRKKKCVELILALQKLFVLMLFGNKKFIDPTEVMDCLIDASGNVMKVGEQLDIGEFSINFFERIEEGLSLNDDSSILDSKLMPKKPASFQDIFFGKSKDYITFEWDKCRSKKNQDNVFGPISLSVEQKELILSLDNYINFSIDEYRTPDGEVTTATKKIWITKAPKVLTFNLQRSVYEKEKGLVKASGAFNFPKELKIDRYLLENKKSFKELNSDIEKMKRKLKMIDAENAKMQCYGKSQIDLISALEASAEFIDNQAEEVVDDFVEVNSDTSIDRIEDCGELTELQKMSEMLRKYKENIIKRTESLEHKKQVIKERIEKAFKDLNKARYVLHGIVVHEGGINSGHYYTLIYNHKTKKWTKYNDLVVSDISEEEAFKLAIGGHGSDDAAKPNIKAPCAYTLFYIDASDEMLDFSPECLENLKKLLSKELLSFAENENSQFLTEHHDFNNNLVQKMNDEYLSRMNKTTFEAAKFQKDLANKSFPFVPTVPNFHSFLLLEFLRYSEVARWNCLKTILKENKVPYNVMEGQSKNYYYRELKELVVLKPSMYNLKSLQLEEKDRKLLKQKRKEYVILIQYQTVIEEIFKLINQVKWKEALATVSYLHEILTQVPMNEYTGQFYAFASYLLAILALRFCALIDNLQADAKTQQALKLLEFMIYCLNKKDSIKPSDIFYQQIIANLYNTVNSTGRKNLKEADISIFIHHIKKLEEKCEFLPSQDLSQLISPDLNNTLTAIEKDETIFQSFESRSEKKLNDLFTSIVQGRLKVWSEFEVFLRRRNMLIEQKIIIEKQKSA